MTIERWLSYISFLYHFFIFFHFSAAPSASQHLSPHHYALIPLNNGLETSFTCKKKQKNETGFMLTKRDKEQ